jgi:(S)-citramalyl-CoA lyase
MQDLSLIRSMLFTPADRPDRFAKAAASGADGAVLDLEDGVGLPAKHDARAAALAFLAAPAMAPQNFVWALRLNHVTTVAGLQDLLALRGVAKKPAVVLLPKTESVTEVDIAIRHLAEGDASPAIVALIESGRGLSVAEAIAAHPAVAALAFGGADLAADLDAELAWEPMLFARSRIVQAAAAAAVAAWDVPFLDIHDADGLARETEAAKALGYVCKLAIHPGQIGAINAIFSPTSAQLARAQRIVAAFEQARGGACQVDGRMVDAPVVKAARRTVMLAGRAA